MKWKLDRFDRLSLQRLNTAQLQVVVNDQLSQIEGLWCSFADFIGFVLLMAKIQCIRLEYATTTAATTITTASPPLLSVELFQSPWARLRL